ncbi:MAG: hypothetical protein ACRELY_24450 [Polyangiaceae bacterium]
MQKRFARSMAIVGGLGIFVLAAGASGCSCTIGNVGTGPYEPPLSHPSNVHVGLSSGSGMSMTQQGGDVFVEYDSGAKTLTIYMVNDYTVPALGPSCDFSGARNVTKGGYVLFHVTGVMAGATGKQPVADAAIYNRSPDHFGEIDIASPLTGVTIDIAKNDATGFEATLSSATGASGDVTGKLVATKICPDVAGGDADGGASADAASPGDTNGESMDAGAALKKHKKKKKSGG